MAMERASSTGVKSLRAMFESNKPDSDTVGKSAGAAGIGAGDKPLAKVRTAFVEVEPSAKLIKKMRSNVALADGGKENGQEPVGGKPDGQTAGGARSNGTNGFRAPQDAAQLLPVVLGATVAETAARDETKKANPKSAKPTTRTVVPKSSASNLRPTDTSNLQKPTTRPRTTSKVEPKQKTDQPAQQSEAKTLRAMPSNGRLGGLKVDKTRHAASPSLKAQPKAPNSQSTPPLSKSRSREVLSAHRAPNPAAPPVPNGQQQPKPAGVRSATGFFKPRPKSPTRPVQLPAHLVAHTSSSAAKFGAAAAFPPPPPVPPSDAAPHHQHHHRPQPAKSAPGSRRVSSVSAASARPPHVPAAAAAASSASSSASSAPTRKASTFGPPPKPKPAGGGSAAAALVARPPDDFLARMMRPTASSSSKVRVVDAAQSPHVRPRVARRVASRVSINGSSASASASNNSASEGNTTLSSAASPLRDAGALQPPVDVGTPLLAARDEIPSSPPLDAVVEDLQA
jgi:hypothetical protein